MAACFWSLQGICCKDVRSRNCGRVFLTGNAEVECTTAAAGELVLRALD